jgi:hypothetical protein
MIDGLLEDGKRTEHEWRNMGKCEETLCEIGTRKSLWQVDYKGKRNLLRTSSGIIGRTCAIG